MQDLILQKLVLGRGESRRNNLGGPTNKGVWPGHALQGNLEFYLYIDASNINITLVLRLHNVVAYTTISRGMHKLCSYFQENMLSLLLLCYALMPYPMHD